MGEGEDCKLKESSGQGEGVGRRTEEGRKGAQEGEGYTWQLLARLLSRQWLPTAWNVETNSCQKSGRKTGGPLGATAYWFKFSGPYPSWQALCFDPAHSSLGLLLSA